MSDPKRVQKAAYSYIKKNGPMDKVSASHMAQAIQSGNITLNNNLTIADAHQVAQLIMAISYTASPQRYESGNGKPDPDAGMQLLKSESLRTAPVMQAIAEIAGETSEYSQAVNIQLAAQNKSETMQRSSEQMNEYVTEANKSGVSLDSPEQTPSTQQTESGATIFANQSGGYTRQASGVFQNEKPAQGSGSVTMAADGRGGTYRSGAIQGDRRTQTSSS